MRTVSILPESCTSLGGLAYQLCLPTKKFCDPENTSGSVVPIGTGFNCNVCAPDTSYFIPYKSGDVIHIQTQYFDSYNVNRKNPTNGFGTFIDAVITDGVARIPITTGMVAYGCGKSFQTLEIDTTSLALDTWTVEYTVNNADGSPRLLAQSQEYCKVSDLDCRNTMLIQGKGKGQDCFGNCYSEPEAYTGQLIEYNNQMRFFGSVKDTGGTFDKPESSGGFFSATTFENYRLFLGKKVPPFVKNVLLKQLLAAPTTIVDGEEFTIDSFSVDNQVKTGRMFLFGVDLVRECGGGSC